MNGMQEQVKDGLAESLQYVTERKGCFADMRTGQYVADKKFIDHAKAIAAVVPELLDVLDGFIAYLDNDSQIIPQAVLILKARALHANLQSPTKEG